MSDRNTEQQPDTEGRSTEEDTGISDEIFVEAMRQVMVELAEKMDKASPRNIARTFKDVQKFRIMLSNESDRGCILAATSMIETDLGLMLGAHLINEPKLLRDLFNGNGPLATFSSRISLAYLLGLITKHTHRDCNLIRKIRNKCAHEFNEFTFSRSDISSVCLELSGRRLGTGDELDESSDPRYRFMQTSITILKEIHSTWSQATRPSVKSPPSEESKRKVIELLNTIRRPNQPNVNE